VDGTQGKIGLAGNVLNHNSSTADTLPENTTNMTQHTEPHKTPKTAIQSWYETSVYNCVIRITYRWSWRLNDFEHWLQM